MSRSEVMTQLYRMVERIAPSKANVLILGETGTGKELIAKYLHDLSNRKLKPFLSVNCGALRETLLESELYGHEKGAFTGAYSRKVGLFEVAHGGTILLKEVDQLTPGHQAKLLRFFQEGEIFRIGGKDPIKVDVRVLTASSLNLDQRVVQGQFREDLYYRLNTVIVAVPPLRRRPDDIVTLALEFLNKGVAISKEAKDALHKYTWPGNIQELRNTCERLNVLMHGTTVEVSDLPEKITNPDRALFEEVPYDPDLTLHELERRHILKALNHYNGDKTQTANALGITIKTLYNKLHEYGEI